MKSPLGANALIAVLNGHPAMNALQAGEIPAELARQGRPNG